MSMVVQHNMQATNANRMLGITSGAQAKSTEKLSSGYKINRAADDAAGLAISEKMREKLKSVTRRNGTVDFSQGDTHGIGFYSEKLCIVPAAQGFTIAADNLLNELN